MRSRSAAILILSVGAAIAWVSVEALPRQLGPEEAETVAPAVAECTFLPGHEPLYVATPAQREAFIAAQLKGVASSLRPNDSFSTPAPKNFIDNHVFDKMARDKISSSNLSTDAEFLRRAYLDATGKIPTADAVIAFLNDTTPDKRDKLIDALLATSEYVDRWANFMGDRLDLVMASTQINLRPEARNAWYNFVRDSIAQNKPFDRFVREFITGSGDNTVDGAANFTVRWRQPNGPVQDTYDNLSSVAGEFLGLSLTCISCHDGGGHTNSINLFLTERTRYELWSLAAFFSRTTQTVLRRDPMNNVPIAWTVADNTTGRYVLNTKTGNKTPRIGSRPNEVVLPQYFPDGSSSDGKGPNSGENYRAALARMLTADRQFARATVNYVWRELFGLAIVEPTDNFDLNRISPSAKLPEGWTLQPNQPELLEALATDFEQHQYDLRYLIGAIMKSATYQLSSTYPGVWSDRYIPYFARKFPRRLKAEEIFDIITQVTNRPASYTPSGYTRPVSWAMQLPDTEEPPEFLTRRLLDTFLRGNRDDIARSDEGSIAQALALLNDTFVTTRVKTRTAGTTVATLFSFGLPPSDLVRRLYLITLSRYPTTDELTKSISFLGNPISASRLEILQKALINKVDFIFNY